MSISGDVQNINDIADKKMAAVLEHLQIELRNIRTGRANPAMLDSVHAEVYGTNMRLKELATISAPESRQLLITPFDTSNAHVIGKAIEKSELGFLVVVEGNTIRIMVPEMDEGVRKEMVKQCKKRSEECKIGIRNVRRDCNEFIKKQKSGSEITEDMVKRFEKSVQELTDKYCKMADDLSHKKEKEVLEI